MAARTLMRTGAFPGSFDPPTVAHLRIARAARDRHDLDRVDLVVSRVPLVKGVVARPRLRDRLTVLEALAARHGWLGVTVTDAQLVVDLARGYDVVVMGADKWHQLHDPEFYGGSTQARDDAVAALPVVAVAGRPPLDVPEPLRLDVDPALAAVSSTRARAGEPELMVPEAADFDLRTGAWTDPDRYDRWLAGQPPGG